jgi:hypothetical protein
MATAIQFVEIADKEQRTLFFLLKFIDNSVTSA